MSQRKLKDGASATTLPGGSNALSRAMSKRLTYIREERGVDSETAAKQCGLSPARWKLFEAERALPTQPEVERICRWAFEGMNFWSFPLSQERKTKKISKGDGWKTHKYNVPKALDIRIIRTAKRLNVSISALTQLAIEHFLEKENVISTFEEAARRIDKARIVDRVNEDPYLQSFLSGDLDIAVSIGAKLNEAPKEEAQQTPAERLVERFNATHEDSWEILS